MQNALLVIDLLLAALTVKERIEAADLRFMATLKTAMAEGRDLTDEEVDAARFAYMEERNKWHSNRPAE